MVCITVNFSRILYCPIRPFGLDSMSTIILPNINSHPPTGPAPIHRCCNFLLPLDGCWINNEWPTLPDHLLPLPCIYHAAFCPLLHLRECIVIGGGGMVVVVMNISGLAKALKPASPKCHPQAPNHRRKLAFDLTSRHWS